MKSCEIVIRDPFVLPVESEKCYYLYGSTLPGAGYAGRGFYCFRSRDLENWEALPPVFLKDENFWATECFWAPEVHFLNGRYYMTATFASGERPRGTQILAADHPAGPFKPVSPYPVTPANWAALDGTLFVEDGRTYMVFCHEWLQIHDGSIELVPLTDDLTAPAGECETLFHASDAPWVRPINYTGEDGIPNFVTDGPFLFKKDGKLLMLWSSFGDGGYTMGIAESVSGSVHGPWKQHEKPFFTGNGGHGMIFQTFDGRLMCTLHQPNEPDEHPVFMPFDLP